MKRRAYREWTYWGRPVPGFGDPRARLIIVGLALVLFGMVTAVGGGVRSRRGVVLENYIAADAVPDENDPVQKRRRFNQHPSRSNWLRR